MQAYRIAKGGASENFWQQVREAAASTFPNKNDVEAVAAALTRTGLLVPASAWSDTVYVSGPELINLCEYAELEELPDD